MAKIEFTNKQIRMLKMLSKGMNTRIIALDFGLSYRTVEKHVQILREKLKAKNVTHLVALCIKKGIIS